MTTYEKKQFQELHRKGSRTFYEAQAIIFLYFVLAAGSMFFWSTGMWPLMVLCWLVQMHLGHTSLLLFHEASHYTVHRKRFLNEAVGIVAGTLILVPLSVFRWAHATHHEDLGTVRDPELWPYTDPAAPRWLRCLVAFGELTLGFFVTPLLFLRGILTLKRRPPGVARRVVLEYMLCVLTWSAVLGVTAWLNAWILLLIGYLIPAMISGNLHSLRKFIEHMGLLGDSVPTLTRTVIHERPLGHFLSYSLLHIDYHGPHHLQPKIPHYNLPDSVPLVYANEVNNPHDANVFRSYSSAFLAMIRTLANPRVGSQWLNASNTMAKGTNSVSPNREEIRQSA